MKQTRSLAALVVAIATLAGCSAPHNPNDDAMKLMRATREGAMESPQEVRQDMGTLNRRMTAFERQLNRSAFSANVQNTCDNMVPVTVQQQASQAVMTMGYAPSELQTSDAVQALGLVKRVSTIYCYMGHADHRRGNSDMSIRLQATQAAAYRQAMTNEDKFSAEMIGQLAKAYQAGWKAQ